MNYIQIYTRLMERSTTRTLGCYTERHHIHPKCMGGVNEPHNIAILTPEEHFIAHQLLVKIYPHNKELIFAANKGRVTINVKVSYYSSNKYLL